MFDFLEKEIRPNIKQPIKKENKHIEHKIAKNEETIISVALENVDEVVKKVELKNTSNKDI